RPNLSFVLTDVADANTPIARVSSSPNCLGSRERPYQQAWEGILRLECPGTIPRPIWVLSMIFGLVGIAFAIHGLLQHS
ncbi:MAG: hypothetical protein ABSH20_29980, partial [Tepidisphaeraceae bacterium]